jgi:hypothetical protein
MSYPACSPPPPALIHLPLSLSPVLRPQVHRGAYEAALALYDRFLPLVQEAVDACPFGRVCFTVSAGVCAGRVWGKGSHVGSVEHTYAPQGVMQVPVHAHTAIPL